jgi:hypothetical protein
MNVATGKYLFQQCTNALSRWRTPRQIDIDRNNLMHRIDPVEQPWHDTGSKRHLTGSVGALDIDGVQKRLRVAEHVTQRGNIPGDCAIAKCDHQSRPLAHLTDQMQVVLIGDSAFHQRDIDTIRIFLHIGERTVDQIDTVRQFEEPLVEIEK